MLDSCHASAFLTRFVCASYAQSSRVIFPFASVAACLHDEVAWEADHLRHGLMSYGVALANGSEELGDKPRIDIRPLGLGTELTLWKLVPFLTHGRQNPVVFHEAGQFALSISDAVTLDFDHPDVDLIEAGLVELRRRHLPDVRALSRFLPPGVSLDSRIRAFERAARNIRR
jgi:hypothetical protein